MSRNLKLVILGFAFSLSVSFVLTYLIIPNIESIHIIDNIFIGNDAKTYFEKGSFLANDFKNNYFTNIFYYLSIFPSFTLIIGALIFIFGQSLVPIIIINSLLHSISAFYVQKMFSELLNKQALLYLPFFLYLMMPINFLWISQPLKEPLINFLIIYLLYKILTNKINSLLSFKKLKLLIIPFLLILSLRPYIISLILINYFFVFTIFNNLSFKNIGKLLIIITLLTSLTVIFFYIFSLEFYLIDFFNVRQNAINFNLEGNNSMISINLINPNSILDYLLYLPLYFFYGLLEPIIFLQSNYHTIFFDILYIHQLLFYLLLPGLFLLFFNFKFNNIHYLIISFSLSIAFLSYMIPNIGTLFRIKYIFWILIIISSSIGYFFLLKKIYLNLNKINFAKNFYFVKDSLIIGIIVVFSSLLFFIRDFIMIGSFGFSKINDVYFLFTIFVTISTYIITSPLHEFISKNIDTQNLYLIRSQFIKITFFSIFYSFMLIFFFYFILKSNFDNTDEFINYLLFLPIIIPLSAISISGNSVLNFYKLSLHSTIGGFIVPLSNLIGILIFDFNIIIEIVIGTIVGILLNIIYIYLISKKNYEVINLITQIYRTKIQANSNNLIKSRKYISFIFLNSLIYVPFLISFIFVFNKEYGSLTYWSISYKIIIFFFLIFHLFINFIAIPIMSKYRNSYFINKKNIYDFLFVYDLIKNFLLVVSFFIIFSTDLILQYFNFSNMIVDSGKFNFSLYTMFLALPFLTCCLFLIKFLLIMDFYLNKTTYILLLIIIFLINLFFNHYFNNLYLFAPLISYLFINGFLKFKLIGNLSNFLITEIFISLFFVFSLLLIQFNELNMFYLFILFFISFLIDSLKSKLF